MNLTKLVLRRPVSVVMIIITIVLFGISSITSMEQELTPDMNMPMLVVMTTYKGASPEDVDELVTSVVEDNLSTLTGVESYSSNSSEGSSTVMLEYGYDTDMGDAYDEVNKRMSMIEMQLPDGAGEPSIMEMDMNSSASIMLTVSGEPAGGLYNYVTNSLQPVFESLSSVADVSVMGGAQEYISISLNRTAMEQYGLSMSDVSSAIASADFTASIGETTLGNQTINVSAGQDFATMESLKNVAISTKNGGVITLSDVGTVSKATSDRESISQYDGMETITMSISKQQSFTASKLSEQVNEALAGVDQTGDGVVITVANDDAESIESSITSVAETVVLAILISMIILFLFLGDLRGSLIIASSMPVSVLVAMILMNVFGYTLNLITMCALVIGVGMMVDNSIVVLESCFRARERGLSLLEAAQEGTHEVMASVTAGTITTVVVFLPLAFVGGMVGQLFKPLGFVIVFALLASLLSALTIVPLAYYKYHPVENDRAPLSGFMRMLTRNYRRAITYLLHRKKTVFGTVALMLVISILALSQVGSELMASTDQGTISISVTTQEGLDIESVEEICAQVTEVITANENVEHYSLTAGGQGMMASSGANYTVYLKDDRNQTTDEIISQWKTEMADILNCDIEVGNSSFTSGMSMSADTVSVVLQGDDYSSVKSACEQIAELMKDRADVARVSSTFSKGKPVAKINFDPQLCAAYGFSASNVATQINNTVNGITAMELTENGKEYDVKVEFADESYNNIDEMMAIQVTSNTGYTVAISDIATLTYEDSAETIRKENGMYNASVDIEIKQDYVATSYNDIYKTASTQMLPTGVSYGSNSMQAMMNDEFSTLYKAIALALFLVFAVMTMQFESARFAIMVMVCIPFSFIGSFLIMYFTGSSISMVSLLGFVMLIGTVVNAGILYVDTANHNRETMDLDTALIEAGVTRLRPILLTTLTTICSMIPLALGMGENSEMLQGFAIVAIGGLTASTLMALLLLPTFYLVMCKKDKTYRKQQSEKKRSFFKKKKASAENTENA